MTENEAIVNFKQELKEPLSPFSITMCNMAITALEKVQKFEAIGTIEEFKNLKEKEEQFDRNITMFNSIGLEIRNKAIDEAIETSSKAICVGCGYLDGYKCTYKGCNCGVSKPMLESVVKALVQLKGGAIDG